MLRSGCLHCSNLTCKPCVCPGLLTPGLLTMSTDDSRSKLLCIGRRPVHRSASCGRFAQSTRPVSTKPKWAARPTSGAKVMVVAAKPKYAKAKVRVSRSNVPYQSSRHSRPQSSTPSSKPGAAGTSRPSSSRPQSSTPSSKPGSAGKPGVRIIPLPRHRTSPVRQASSSIQTRSGGGRWEICRRGQYRTTSRAGKFDMDWLKENEQVFLDYLNDAWYDGDDWWPAMLYLENFYGPKQCRFGAGCAIVYKIGRAHV